MGVNLSIDLEWVLTFLTFCTYPRFKHISNLKSQISNHDFWRHFEKEKDEGLWRTKGAGLEQGLAVEHALGVHIPGYHSVHANAQQPDHTFSTVCTPTRNSQITHLAQVSVLTVSHIQSIQPIRSMMRECSAREAGHAKNPRTCVPARCRERSRWLFAAPKTCRCNCKKIKHHLQLYKKRPQSKS